MSEPSASVPIRIRDAIEADRPYLAWLEEACMRDYAVALWGVWRTRPGESLNLRQYRILVASERDAGCIGVRREVDHLWIDALYVAPGFQNRGIGAAALRIAVSEGAAEGLPVRLRVLTTNPALAFYLRNGLVVERETVERRYLTTSR